MCDDHRLLDVDDVARLLKVDKDVIRAAVKAGQLKRTPIGGPRTWRFRLSAVTEYLDLLDRLEVTTDEPAPEAVVTLGRGRRRVVVN